MLNPLLLLLQHLFAMLLKCELLLLISSSRDIPKTCVLSFHMHNNLPLLIFLFLFLEENNFFHHFVSLRNFLLFLSDYVVFQSHTWDFVPCCFPLTKFWRTLVMFDHFWDFDRLVDGGARDKVEIMGS